MASALSPQDLREFRRQLAEASGKRKLDLLFSSPDPVAAVRALPEPELYLALIEIGLGDAADVLSLASPEQFVHFVDRSTWPRSDEGPDTKAVLHWLTLARESATSDQSLERYRAKLAGLDTELLGLVLREQLKVHSLEENSDPPIEDWGRTYSTPEGKYVVEFVGELGDYGTLKQILDDLFAQDPFVTTRLLESLRWEVPSELAEEARRWRTGRLRDLGFPQLDEALALYARPAKRAPPAAKPAGASSSSTALAPARHGLLLLDRALALVPFDEMDRVEESIVYAANAALVANGVEPDDALGVRTTLSEARSLLSLGLDVLAAGDADRAAALLAERPIKEIFQAGMGELYTLQTKARQISQAARLPGAKTATVLESPWTDLLAALDRKRPTLLDPAGKGRTRAPASRADIAAADASLDEAAAVLRILEVLGISPTAIGPAAEAAGLAPSAVRVRDVLLARARADLLGLQGVSFGDPGSESGTGPSPEETAARRDALVADAARSIGSEAAARAATALANQRQKRS